jgi:hypothetical protein
MGNVVGVGELEASLPALLANFCVYQSQGVSPTGEKGRAGRPGVAPQSRAWSE